MLLGWTAVLAAVRVVLQYIAAGPAAHFYPYGLNSVVAWLALALAVAAFFVRPAGRATALAALFILSIIADMAAAAVELGAPHIASAAPLTAFWVRATTGGAIFAVEVVWWLGAIGFVKRLLGAVHENTLTAPMRHEQAVSSFSVAAFATGPLGHRRSRR